MTPIGTRGMLRILYFIQRFAITCTILTCVHGSNKLRCHQTSLSFSELNVSSEKIHLLTRTAFYDKKASLATSFTHCVQEDTISGRSTNCLHRHTTRAKRFLTNTGLAYETSGPCHPIFFLHTYLPRLDEICGTVDSRSTSRAKTTYVSTDTRFPHSSEDPAHR